MKFSVVTVCRNSASTIADTIRSVSKQTFTDYEHLIVDGASTDNTPIIVSSFAKPQLRFISEPDDGMYDAMNKGLRLATGDYVLFLNSDDFLARDDVFFLINELARRSDADCIFAATRMINEHQGTISTKRHYSIANFRPWWLRIGVMPPHPSSFIRREKLLEAGGFDTSFRVSSDFDLIAKVVLRDGASWAVEPRTVTNFRIGGISTSGVRANFEVNRDIVRSLRELGQPLPWFSAQLRYLWKFKQLVRLSAA